MMLTRRRGNLYVDLERRFGPFKSHGTCEMVEGRICHFAVLIMNLSFVLLVQAISAMKIF